MSARMEGARRLLVWLPLAAGATLACGESDSPTTGHSANGGTTASGGSTATGGAAGSAGSVSSGGMAGSAGAGGGSGGFDPCAPSAECHTSAVPANGTCQGAGLVGCSHAAYQCCIPASEQTVAACNCFSKCASPDTPVATPEGPRPIASLAVGDRVLSMDGGQLRAVPLISVVRVPVHNHAVARVVLENGSVLEITAAHPTADGRTLADLGPGASLGGVKVLAIETVPYRQRFTYDVLPASDTGTYIAGGALIGSTLWSP